MEGSSRRKLGDGPEPAAHGRQDVSAYAAIRCCLLNRFTQNSRHTLISSSRAVFHLSNDNVCNKDVLPVLIGHVSRHIIRLAIVIPGNARPCFFYPARTGR